MTYLPKSDYDGVYNWSQNRLQWGGGSDWPAAHIQQKFSKVFPPPSPWVLVITRDYTTCNK